jgi:hypothetical protein
MSSSILEEQACCLIHVGFLLGLLFCPEDGGEVFFQIID